MKQETTVNNSHIGIQELSLDDLDHVAAGKSGDGSGTGNGTGMGGNGMARALRGIAEGIAGAVGGAVKTIINIF